MASLPELLRRLSAGLTRRRAPVPRHPGALVFDGDSIIAGHGIDQTMRLPDQVAAALAFGGPVSVVAQGGRPVADCERLFDQLVAPARTPGRDVIFFHAGDNDIALGRDAPATYRALASYIAKAHAAGFAVVVSTELQHFEWPASMRDELAAFNALMLANTAGADGIVDYAADPVMGGAEARADRRLYLDDGVHPTEAGYAAFVPATVAELRRHLQPPG